MEFSLQDIDPLRKQFSSYFRKHHMSTHQWQSSSPRLDVPSRKSFLQSGSKNCFIHDIMHFLMPRAIATIPHFHVSSQRTDVNTRLIKLRSTYKVNFASCARTRTAKNASRQKVKLSHCTWKASGMCFQSFLLTKAKKFHIASMHTKHFRSISSARIFSLIAHFLSIK